MFKKHLARLLSILMIASLLPMHAGAESNDSGSGHSTENSTASAGTGQNEDSAYHELVSDRDAYSKTYTNNEGDFKKEIYQEPIHRKDDGKWVNISDKLVEDEDNANVVEADNTTLDATFPKTYKTSDKDMTFSVGNHDIIFSNLSASDGSTTTAANPSARTKYEDNQIMYQNIFNGIDLRHVTFNEEVKEDWIINQYTGINQFNYIIKTDLAARLNGDGSVGFYQDSDFKDQVFVLPRPQMEDSNYNDGLGSGVKSNDLHYSLSADGDGQYKLSLTADKDWLESKDRVYPVYVDPSVSLDVNADTFVASAYPTTNYNKEWDSSQGEYVLKVGKYDNTTGTNYAYMKFAIPSDLKGAIIDSADLKAYITHSYYATTKTSIWVDRVQSSWSADTMNWNNKPGSTNITSTTAARNQWATFNVKGTVQGVVDGEYPNYGFKFHENGNGQTYWKKITASESANKAKLVVTYHYPEMKSPTLSAAQTSAGSATGYVNVSWPKVNNVESYSLQMYDGKSYETVYKGTATSWTTKGKKIFPKSPYSTSSAFKTDGTGVELPVDPSAFYSAKSGTATKNKNYQFRVIANYPGGSSPASTVVSKPIPNGLVDTPDRPDVKASAYSESDSVNKGRGWLDISWDPVEGATGYIVRIYNGKDYQDFNAGNATSWSTKGQKLWPTDSEIAAGKYLLHLDKTGAELPIDPNPVYKNAVADGGGYDYFHRYSITIKAVCPAGTTPSADTNYGYIPLETPKNVAATAELADPVSAKGILNVKWDAVTGAGGYLVEISTDGGKTFRSPVDVGKVTSWKSTGKLELDPGKGYQVRVKAYRYNDAIAPSSEKEKISGPRGVSAASAIKTVNMASREDLLGLEDDFTYGTHTMGNATVSVNVTTGNLNMAITDASLYPRGVLDFDFTRSYNSGSTRSSAFGTGWTFAGNESLVTKPSSSNLYYDDEDGTRHEFVYNPGNDSFTSPKGKYLSLKKQTVNGASGFALTDKDGFTKLFESAPTSGTYRLYAYQDTNHNTIRFKYTNNQLTEIAETDSSGSTIGKSITLAYNADGLVSKMAYNNRWIEYQYNDADRPKLLTDTVTHAEGTSKTITNSYDYEDNGDRLSSFTDGNGNEGTMEYKDNEITVVTPQKDGASSVSTTYNYDLPNNKFTVTDSNDSQKVYHRNTANNTFAVTETVDENGKSGTVQYDANYNIIKSTDAEGNTETKVYDANGNVTKETDAEGNVTTYAYNAQNLLTSKTDPKGVTTTYSYDGNRNLTETQVGDEITKFEYDAYGRQTKEIYPNETYTETAYTDHTVTEKDAKGNTTSTTYDDNGQIVSQTDGAGRKTSYTYDSLTPDLKTSVTDGNGNKTSYTYDNNGNMLTVTNAKNVTKSYTYNNNNQVLSVTLPVGSGSDPMKMLYTYDEDGNLQTFKKASGILETYQYDEAGQLTGTTVADASGKNEYNIANTYDDNGQVTKTALKDATGAEILAKTYAYTDNGLVSQYNQGDSYQINNEYNDDDSLKSDTYSYHSQSVVVKNNYTYIESGKADTVNTTLNGDTLLQFQYGYDLDNRKDSLTANNGLFKQTTTLDTANNIQSIQYFKGSSTTAAAQFAYQYDGSANITKETTAKGDTSYTYDQNNQLTKEILPDGTTNSYTYDAVGNRTQATVNGKTYNYTYNDANQIVKKNGTAFTYDKDGNLTQDENDKYTYNALGQMTKVTTLSGTTVAEYTYDENGLRTKKTVGTKTNEYYYDQDNNLSMEVVKNNGTITQYKYYKWDSDGTTPLGMIIRQQDSTGQWANKAYFFWTNHRGDVISIVDQSGNEVGSYTYDAYGNVLTETGEIAKYNPIRYAGYYYDAETKDYYLKARYYNPANGTFLAMDPQPG
ncbi:DNRLRE domain-containing protein, partial [Heyndrickxia coagulans]|uniref:DNRLRE domain-containing protein n=5 Tax=Heyndrickxia coagulans TaxID=1398 RepID=UPI002E224277|nr:DNRLRE domain-containing protein [Heyndrickxia coagulans]